MGHTNLAEKCVKKEVDKPPRTAAGKEYIMTLSLEKNYFRDPFIKFEIQIDGSLLRKLGKIVIYRFGDKGRVEQICKRAINCIDYIKQEINNKQKYHNTEIKDIINNLRISLNGLNGFPKLTLEIEKNISVPSNWEENEKAIYALIYLITSILDIIKVLIEQLIKREESKQQMLEDVFKYKEMYIKIGLSPLEKEYVEYIPANETVEIIDILTELPINTDTKLSAIA